MSDAKNKPAESVDLADMDAAAAAEKIVALANAKAKEIEEAAEKAAKEKLEAAEKEARAKAAEAEKAKADKEAEKNDAKEDPAEELVDYIAPLLPNMKKRDILVAVNGETLRIKRGVPVKIKRKFYEALQNAAMQEYAAMETQQEIKRQGEKPMASM